MSWVLIKKILSKKIKSLNLEGAMKLNRLQQDWDKILSVSLGKNYLKRSRPIKLKNKVLFVACYNSVWANELRLKEKILIEKNEYKFKEIGIESIKFIS